MSTLSHTHQIKKPEPAGIVPSAAQPSYNKIRCFLSPSHEGFGFVRIVSLYLTYLLSQTKIACQTVTLGCIRYLYLWSGRTHLTTCIDLPRNYYIYKPSRY